MNSADEGGPGQRLAPEDVALLEAIRTGNEWLRMLLCTLARRGATFRLAEPVRARQILQMLEPLPLYKGGQFLFDLLEWEDFMVDGEPPPLLPSALDARALRSLETILQAAKAALDGQVDGSSSMSWEFVDSVSAVLPAEDLQPLEAGFYLYQDVVLGVLRSVAAVQAIAAQLDLE